MGFILPEIYQSICQSNDKLMPKIFVETGTYKGGVAHQIIERTKKLDKCFDHYYTIELSEDICKCASRRYKYIEEYNFNPSFDKLHTDELDQESISGFKVKVGYTEIDSQELKIRQDAIFKILQGH